MHRRLSLAVIATVLLIAGCTTDPLNGTAFATNVKGTSFTMKGFYWKPSIPIDLEVLKQPNLDPAIDGNWAVIGSTASGTTELHWNSTDPLYAWSKAVTPVSAGAVGAELLRWPAGKLARLRAVAHDPSGDRVLTSFDDATYSNCFGDHASQSWSDIGLACESQLGPLTIVSATNNPSASNFDYLGTVIHSHPDLTDAQVTSYYTSIGAPATLPDWLTKYGFPAGEVVTAYYNEADLGFGRQMHCRKSGTGVACYVKNYGTTSGMGAFPAEPSAALSLATNLAGHTQFATVAMVYTPPDGVNAVKFFVYGADDKLSTNATLDSTNTHHSPPSNCLTCHGINANVTISGGVPSVTGARFLPFDIFSFQYSTSASFTQAAQADKFSNLNALVAATPMAPATSTLIKGMYGGTLPTFGSPLIANNRFIPPDWDTSNGDRTMYEGVVKPYCRGCHVTAASPDLNSPTDLTIACNGHAMPHAQQTLRRFWNGGARAYLSGYYGLAGTNDCTP